MMIEGVRHVCSFLPRKADKDIEELFFVLIGRK